MRADDAATLAADLMAEFGLIENGWSFRFDTARKRFGCCKRSADGRVRLIQLSRPLTVANDRAAVEDTLRHEIAHALAPIMAGHSGLWRDACKLTGARPQAYYRDGDVKPAAGMWRFTCEACGLSATRARRASAGAYHCRNAALRWERAA